MKLKRRQLMGGLAALLLAGPARAQVRTVRVVVPYYGPIHVLQGLHGHWTQPRAAEFAATAKALSAALGRMCAQKDGGGDAALRGAREGWGRAMLAWERFTAVPLGPLIQRRSLRAIDFVPTRPASIERAVAGMAGGAIPDLELIGTPAKGLPALEWLLWTKPVAPGSTACRYAGLLAGEIEREALALQKACAALAARVPGDWSDEAAVAGVSELLNQWVGGIERLRWPRMEKPLRAGRPEEFPRAASGQTAASWAAQWSALRALAVADAPEPPAPGKGLVTLEWWLRGRGSNGVADKLVQQLRKVDSRLRGLVPGGAVREAARELAALKYLAESEVAPALQVSIGFSDADGD